MGSDGRASKLGDASLAKEPAFLLFRILVSLAAPHLQIVAPDLDRAANFRYFPLNSHVTMNFEPGRRVFLKRAIFLAQYSPSINIYAFFAFFVG